MRGVRLAKGDAGPVEWRVRGGGPRRGVASAQAGDPNALISVKRVRRSYTHTNAR